MKNLFTLFFCLVFIPFSLFANIINVPSDQPSIQDGINAAVNGDTVLVADSTYYENINFNGKAITVASHFLIDGDTTHIDSTIINGSQPSNPDIGSVVRFVSGEDTNSVLCGFTITGGTGIVRSNSNVVGGGIYIFNSGAYILNNIITQNVIYSPNHFSNGGGIRCYSDTLSRKFLYLFGNQIVNNQALSGNNIGTGGGVDIWGSDAHIENNKICYNNIGGGSYCFAAGIRLAYSTSKSKVKNNNISYNSYQNGTCYAGGLFLVGNRDVIALENYLKGNSSSFVGGIYLSQCINNQIVENKVYNNSATSGAGIVVELSINTEITDNQIVGNTAIGNPGAGIVLSDSHAKIVKNLISGNSTTSYGGGMAIFKSSPKSNFKMKFLSKQNHFAGAGIAEDEQINPYQENFAMLKKTGTDSQTVLVNNTITDNYAALGGGIYNEFESTLIINSILYGDSAISDPEIYNYGGTVIVEYCDIMGGYPGTGNIDVDPLFSDTLYHLLPKIPFVSPGSPCIDKGNPHPKYYDPEDPGNPGYALFPALGTIRNDMGAYGGITDSIIPHILGLHAISNKDLIPQEFTLSQNYPNPFNPITNIEFQLTNNDFVTLKIYDILGQEVVTLVSERLNLGKYKYVWDASGFASGIYFYKLSTDKGFSKERKLILLR